MTFNGETGDVDDPENIKPDNSAPLLRVEMKLLLELENGVPTPKVKDLRLISYSDLFQKPAPQNAPDEQPRRSLGT
jgi:hypothetical protein